MADMDGGFYEGVLKNQVFQVDPKEDQIIETKGGIVLLIPEGCFDTKGKVEVVVKEALEYEDIILAGLQTKTTSNEILETEGMFRFEAFQNGKRIEMQSGKAVQVKFPAKGEVDPSMVLWKGKRMQEGDLLWEEPSKIERYLQPFEISELNFYPPEYEDALIARGLPMDKNYKDSLYYSFSGYCGSVVQANEFKIAMYDDTLSEEGIIDDSGLGLDAVPKKKDRKDCNVIDPERIRAIWQTKFNNTNLATKEFEERLAWIHRFCEKKVFDLYAKNLDKNLYELDSMAIQIYRELTYLPVSKKKEAIEKFTEFYNRKQSKVKIDDESYRKLNAYIEEKLKQIEEANAKKKGDLIEKIKNLKSQKERLKVARKHVQRENIRFQKTNYYSFEVKAFGYYNVDAIRHELQKLSKNKAIRPTKINLNTDDIARVMIMPKRFDAYMIIRKSVNGYQIKIGNNPKYDVIAFTFLDSSRLLFDYKSNQSTFLTDLKLKKSNLRKVKQILRRAGDERVVGIINNEFEDFQREEDRKKKMKVEFEKRKQERAKIIEEQKKKEEEERIMKEFRDKLSNEIFCGCVGYKKKLSMDKFDKNNLATGFTPNGDGINDIWPGNSLDYFGFRRLRIYTKYKIKLVFQTGDPNEGWDGTDNGVPLPGDQYEYVIEYMGRFGKEKLEGSITLLRDQ